MFHKKHTVIALGLGNSPRGDRDFVGVFHAISGIHRAFIFDVGQSNKQ